MKKIFPAIGVLTALSIIGLIIIQVQWFSNLLVVQGERFIYKVDRASFSVAQDLGKQALSGRVMKLQRRRDMGLMPDNFSFGTSKLPTIADNFTDRQIAEKLREAFDKEDLQNFRFEFAVTANADEYSSMELQSKKFSG